MPDTKEPASTVIPETPWDETPMEYIEVPPTDEDGNPLETVAPAAPEADDDTSLDTQGEAKW